MSATPHPEPRDDEPAIAPAVQRPPREIRDSGPTPTEGDLGNQVGTDNQSPDLNRRV